jgi:hypothetical protein
LVFNLAAWFLPLFFVRGLLRNYLFIIAFLFSSSNWISVYFYSYSEAIPVGVVADFLEESLYLSILASLSFYIGFYILIQKKIKSRMIDFIDLKNFGNIQWTAGVGIIKAILIILLPLTFFMALKDVGLGDRVYFLDVINPFWYSVLLPINSFLLLGWLIFDGKAIALNSIKKDALLWLFIIHIFLVGFDGGRRLAIMPIFMVFLKVAICNLKYNQVIWAFNFKTCLSVCLLFFSTFLTLNRAYDVGWGIFNQNLTEISRHTPIFFELILAPSPTLHVTTQMLDLINNEGAHGSLNYFKAIGNLFFPKFIFGQYFFGEPLVNELHERFNWYGQDFGFMAEAIYSGGWRGVALMHFIFGLFVAKVINGYTSLKYSLFFEILSLTIIFGMVNSLRSDFMNITKATFYPAVALFLIVFIYKKIKKIKIVKEKKKICVE